MRRILLDEVFHLSRRPLAVGELRPGGSRWGHDGVYTSIDPERPTPGFYLYRIPGPHVVLGVEDDEAGSWDLLRGWGSDEEWNSLLAEVWTENLGPFPYAPRPDAGYWIDEAREFERRLRERLEADGFDGYWAGGEVVLWNYDKLAMAEPYTFPRRWWNPNRWIKGDR